MRSQYALKSVIEYSTGTVCPQQTDDQEYHHKQIHMYQKFKRRGNNGPQPYNIQEPCMEDMKVQE